ncbi:sensor histidine kinase [Cellulophaga baltica]|uniref:Two-component sensor histidine kinase, contains HisKA and HATPase domains n=1 Tax=Cellulophaga baltica TaxID=76594 RepID=A0A1G7LIB8_9FLAO|nr:sensor histidine kinase [Cellulophaga baltica]SDF49277.1 Two-component sensor histidine kinase, contains HisKA and HATPase domains [Cellulophaga baltica]
MSKKLIAISIALFAILSVAIWVITVIRINKFEKNLLAIELADSEAELKSAHEQLLNLYETSKKKVLFFKDLVEANYNQTKSFKEVGPIFYYFLKNEDDYFQARIIDPDGKELLKVENMYNNVSIYENKHLEDKSNRYYVQKTLKLKKGQTFVSNIDLNIENNIIETPYRPTVRFFTKIFDPDDNLLGIVGLNLNAATWLNGIGTQNISILNNTNEIFYDEHNKNELYTKSTVDLTEKDRNDNPIYNVKKITIGGMSDWTLYTSMHSPEVQHKIKVNKKNTIYFSIFLNLGLLFFMFTIHNLYYKNKHISSLNNAVNLRLEERNTLLKEIHHRVKNNLQVITSLLNLQSRYIQDEDVKSMLKYSQYRIKSIALLHESLYRSDDLSKINYADYLKQLVNGLIISMKGSTNKITLDLEVDEIYFNIDTSIPLGLIINELVTNSLKYAFNDNIGIITISLKKQANNSFLLHIGDNGKGFPKKVKFRDTDTLGLKLVHKLVLQLNGNIEKDNLQTGTTFIITFQEIQELS